jgi:hypothetical protein
MSDQPQQPDVIDPDNIPETICDGAFNLSFVGPNAVITFTYASRRGATIHPGQ